MRPQREQSLAIRTVDNSRRSVLARIARPDSEPANAPSAFSYVLPLSWPGDLGRAELTEYLSRLANACDDIIVVDGSPTSVFSENRGAFGHLVRHVGVDPTAPGKMRKVPAVMQGVHLASHEAVVIADDDVRYGVASLLRAVRLLEKADIVRPQNYFDPLPWHARWDTARTLLNRAIGADFPGTLVVRRSTLITAGGYDADVLFENLELIRTIRAVGGRAVNQMDLYVRRLPPSTRHFLEQRPRQAYEDFGIPMRMGLWLTILPAFVAFPRRRRATVLLLAGASIFVAEVGRRRDGGREVFPPSSTFLAPAWLLERSFCAWLAVLARLKLGGMRYRDTVIFNSANSMRVLRRRQPKVA